MLGPCDGDGKSVKVWGRTVIWQFAGKGHIIIYEADPRHAEITMKEVGARDATPPSPPATGPDDDGDEGDVGEFVGEQAARFRSIAARVDHLVLDRPETQYACNGVSTSMGKPICKDWGTFRRFAKYFEGSPRLVHRCWGAR